MAKKLSEFGEAQTPPIRRVRILKKQEEFIPIKDRKTGDAYRAVIAGEMHHVDIVEDDKGKWVGFFITMFEANQKDFLAKWRQGGQDYKYIMTLHKGDLVKIIDKNNNENILKAYRINPSNNTIYFAAHNESGKLDDRHKDPDDTFQWLMASVSTLKARKCKIYKADELGKLRK